MPVAVQQGRSPVGHLLLTAVLGAAGLLAGCGASGRPSATAPSGQSVRQTCQQVAAVLSDGPDPVADPVGYALAQVRPLRAITTADQPLQHDIDALAAAYQQVAAAPGHSATARSSVTKASRQLDRVCPGATS